MDHDLFHIAYGEEETALDTAVKLTFGSSRVSFGGPSSTNEYKLIHGYGEVYGSTKLCPGVYVGGEDELMDELYNSRFDASNALFVKGHTAWEPDQLQEELSSGSWYMTAASSDFILRYAGAKITAEDNPVDLWSDILSCMGGRYADILKTYRGHGDCRMMMP
jgi:putative transcriptional regulator